MADIVDIYLETGDFHEAVKRSGLPTHIAHLKLIQSGCLKIQDKIQYGLLLLKTQERLSTKFVKFVQDGVFELRTEYNGNI